MFRKLGVLLGLFTVLVLATSGQAARKGYVMREWSTNMRELGIVPIFPPREDVQVGDIYVFPYNPESKETDKLFQKGDYRIGMSPRWATIDSIVKLASDEYQKRMSFPATTVDPLVVQGGILTQPTSGSNKVFVPDATPNRLRQVAFPEFLSASFSQGNLSALIPIEAINLAFGASWSNSKNVVVKIPAAESYAVSAQEVIRALFSYDPTVKKYKLKSQYGDLLTAFQEEPVVVKGKTIPPSDSVWIRVPTEVYYARAMDISVESKKSRGARIGASLILPPAPASTATPSTGGSTGSGGTVTPPPVSPTEEKPKKLNSEAPPKTPEPSGNNAPSSSPTTPPGGGTTPPATPEPPSGPVLIDPATAAYARAQTLNTYLMSTGANKTPGGSIQFVSATDSSISLRRTWERPIAIGSRGVVFKINLKDGFATSSGGGGSGIGIFGSRVPMAPQ
jgi:hypothetical protein